VANNFKCNPEIIGDTLNLHLEGFFDGCSAHEIANLVDKLYKKNKKLKHVVVDTKNVSIEDMPESAVLFGIDVWEKICIDKIPSELSYNFVGGKIKIKTTIPKKRKKIKI